MAKVIVERPRLGGGMKFQRSAERRWQRVSMDERPRRAAIRSAWRESGVSPKHLNENLAPLMRFLRGSVGRPWDAVYSEICEQMDRGSAVQLHIWQHVNSAVLTDPTRIAKWKVLAARIGAWGKLYVDPRTGLLSELASPVTKRVRAERRQLQRPTCDLVTIDRRHFKRIEGLWYEIELAWFPLKWERPAWDAVLRKSTAVISRDDTYVAYGVHRYAKRKRQLNTREIKQLLADAR